MSNPEREKIGSFWIDTGTILLADPCQVVPRTKRASPHWTYQELLDLFETQGTTYTEPALVRDGRELVLARECVQRAEHVTLQSEPKGVAGIVVTTGVDGWYPVYVERDADGSLKRVIIECGGKIEP